MKSKQLIANTIVFFVTIALFSISPAFSQWSITGNSNIASGTNYLGTKDPNDLVFRTNALERGRVLGIGGEWHLGAVRDYTRIDSLGRLSFTGSGTYLVGGGKYVFQYTSNNKYGLFFRSSPLQYEFRNTSSVPVFSVNATTGAGTFSGTLKVGAYTFPATDGTSGQVLKTNGSGALTWGGVNAWSLTGNANTNPLTNFIGTTDSNAFVFKTKNTERMRMSANGNIGIGTTSPVSKLHIYTGNSVALASGGYLQLGKPNDYSLLMDNKAIQSRFDSAAAALFLNPLGGAVAIGGDSISPAFSASINANAAAGGINILDPGDNTALSFSKSGLNRGAFFSKTNTISGVETIYANNSGAGAGISSTSSGGVGVSGYSSNYIGVYGFTGGLQSNGFYAGFFSGAVNATGGYFANSDQNLKKNIEDVTSAMKIINQLKPKHYEFKDEGDAKFLKLPQGIHYGLIAQEVEKILPGLVGNTKFRTSMAIPHPTEEDVKNSRTLQYKSLNYTELIPILIKGMQEQEAVIEKQQQQIDQLQQMVQTMVNNVNGASTGKTTALNAGAYLQQNTPNPFSQNTVIRCNIPGSTGRAQLNIYDSDGKQIKTYSLSKRGMNEITINAGSLASGSYIYTLLIDGKMADSKSMVITK